LFFTFLHDAAGLFSASIPIMGTIFVFSSPAANLVMIIVPIIFFDCGSELALVLCHDLPMCKRKPINKVYVRLALVGQIITALAWFSLFCLVVYFTIFRHCLSEDLFFSCSALLPGISSSVVLLMVFIKNSMTLKEYYDRAFLFPVICNEALLYLYDFMYNEPKAIISHFEQFNSLDENWEPGFTTEPTYNVIINFGVLLLMDVAAIASVSSLIVVTGDSPLYTLLRASPFLLIIAVDMASEIVILLTHDIPICNQDEEVIPEYNSYFQVARVLQVLVELAWLGALIYMILIVAHLNCYDECSCVIDAPSVNCSSPLCPVSNTCNKNGTCVFSLQGTCSPTVPPNINYTSNCTITRTTLRCEQDNPSITACILLSMVLLEGIFQTIGMYFNSYIYPITIPESVMFFCYWMNGDLDKLVEKVGKNLFGLDWDMSQIDVVLTDLKPLLLADSLM